MKERGPAGTGSTIWGLPLRLQPCGTFVEKAERIWNIMKEIIDLPKKQELAIIELLSCPTVREVALKTKVSEVTLYRWLQDDTFRAHYRKVRRKVVEQALGTLQKACSEAVKTLIEVASDKESSAPARVASARTILEFAVKAVELEDLSERIEELERIARSKEKSNEKSEE
jgi:hypothetical protein